MTIMCGITRPDITNDPIIDVHFGRVPQVGETIVFFGKLYEVVGVSWQVEQNERRHRPGGVVIDTIHSATHPIIDIA
jgi:hypothetical protein